MAPGSLLKPIEWVGSALEDLRRCTERVQVVIGYALHLAQLGEYAPAAKRLTGPLGGMVEIVADDDGTTYRAVYTVKLRGVVYVLHVFQKKSTQGIATPRRALALITERYRWARTHYAAHYGSRERR